MFCVRPMERIISFGDRWNVPFTRLRLVNGTFHLSPHEIILTIELTNIHYLNTIALVVFNPNPLPQPQNGNWAPNEKSN